MKHICENCDWYVSIPLQDEYGDFYDCVDVCSNSESTFYYEQTASENTCDKWEEERECTNDYR